MLFFFLSLANRNTSSLGTKLTGLAVKPFDKLHYYTHKIRAYSNTTSKMQNVVPLPLISANMT